ncbi:MAG: DUF4145 domain-containing protein, partial [Candidatus Lokiarchaeota archaeon]|nr:DUF4145 domain-containing protein [Candidatus Lokiarchaeota archaeon]
NKNKVTKRYCYKCRNETNQIIEFESKNFDVNAIYKSGSTDEVGWVVERTDWSFSVCKGCESLNLELVTIHIGPNGIEREVSRKLLPGKSKKQVESWIFGLSRPYIDLLSEVYSAFNNNAYRLAMMGLRTIIDMFIIDTIGDVGSFKNKLKSLKQQTYINNEQFSLLYTSIEAGNASAHRGFEPSKEELVSVIEVVEHLLKPLALKKKVNDLKNKIPKRKKT